MGSLVETVVDGYHDLFTNHRDPRVDGWLLMDSPWPTLLVCLGYVLIVKVIGPQYMKNRPPFQLRNILVAYNAFQVVFSIWIFYEIGMSGWFTHYSFRCQPVDYTDNPSAIRMTYASWWYYFSKFTEFFDTFFFVLHKKFEHVSTLHVIHHGCMPMSVWFGVKFTPGGHSTFFGFINSFVHIVMYVYYMLAALGPRYRRYIWWKKYLTNFQMIQFIMIFGHAFQLCFTECNYPRAFMWWIGGHAVMFFFLFSDFYIKAYLKGAAKVKAFANGTSIYVRSNGHANGSLANGITKLVNGVSNGYANGKANGHANGKTNGFANGHANGVANGYANGHANHANGSIHNSEVHSEETNGHIPKTPDSPSMSTRVRKLMCMNVDSVVD
ncbi:elongation of very long chain fatty acids protein AAEL008004-like isoform X2 [Homarus americanus]|uniref:elongation of very long chain fatty acids protein AAEL008004-like isoform X2 n=1 Tax=Homarus americanus TaxID=6706 RepID=UPI001C44B79E|nr:elongation of very long chain fatty acids protein AAEL008004-like isoform X2 [Homarus americanus]